MPLPALGATIVLPDFIRSSSADEGKKDKKLFSSKSSVIYPISKAGLGVLHAAGKLFSGLMLFIDRLVFSVFIISLCFGLVTFHLRESN